MYLRVMFQGSDGRDINNVRGSHTKKSDKMVVTLTMSKGRVPTKSDKMVQTLIMLEGRKPT